MIKPQLADVTSLPVHSTARHPLTGQPVQAIGFRRNGDPIWPVAGGSQPLGGPPAPGPAQPQVPLPGGQPPAGQFVPGLGGQPVPVFGPGPLPMGQQGMFPTQPQYGQPGAPQQPQQYGQQPYGQQPYVQPQYGQPVGATPPPPYAYGPPQQFPFAAPTLGQLPAAGQPGPQGQPAGQPGQPGAAPVQQPGQQPQGGGQPAAADGTWDKPYPQKPLAEMTDGEQNAYWKYHHRKSEDRIRQMGDYDQIKQQLAQLQHMTQTEWQRAVLDAENRGRSAAMEQAAGQMVAVAFQGAASTRMTPDQIHAALQRLDAKSFVHNGQVDVAAVHAYVDMIAPQRQNGLVPLIPPSQQMQGQQLPLQQITLGAQPGQPGQPLLPGQPGYAQQPTFGPLGQQQYGGQPQYPAQQQYGGQQYGAQQQPYGQQYPVPGQGGYNIPVPGVPGVFQPAMQPQAPAVQGAGLAGLPSLHSGRPGLPAATDFGQGPAVPGPPVNPMQSGAAMAASRHGGRTRSQQLAETRPS